MSSTSTTGEEGDEGVFTVYTCRKCEGQHFRKEELAAHRLFHRQERESRRQTTTRRRGRGRSVESSVGSLFVVREKETPEEPPKQAGRKKKAKETYERNSPRVMNRRNPGA